MKVNFISKCECTDNLGRFFDKNLNRFLNSIKAENIETVKSRALVSWTASVEFDEESGQVKLYPADIMEVTIFTMVEYNETDSVTTGFARKEFTLDLQPSNEFTFSAIIEKPEIVSESAFHKITLKPLKVSEFSNSEINIHF